MVDGEPQVATELLHEPAVMVSNHGAMTFDHVGYRKMAKEKDGLMSDSSTWVRQGGRWACVMHTETPMRA